MGNPLYRLLQPHRLPKFVLFCSGFSIEHSFDGNVKPLIIKLLQKFEKFQTKFDVKNLHNRNSEIQNEKNYFSRSFQLKSKVCGCIMIVALF